MTITKMMKHFDTMQKIINETAREQKEHKQWLEENLTISYAEFEQEFELIRSEIIEVHKLRIKTINDTIEKTPKYAEKFWQERKQRSDSDNRIYWHSFDSVHKHKLNDNVYAYASEEFLHLTVVAYDAWMEAAEFVTHKDKYEKLSDITKNLHTLELFDISRDTMLSKSADYDGAADRYASFKRSAETARFTQPEANVLSEILGLRRKHGQWCIEFQAGNRPNATLADVHEHYGDFYNYTVILYVWIKYSDFAHNKYKLMMVK